MISQLSINVSQNGTSLTYALNGRIDTTTAPQLAANLHPDGARELVFDLAGIDYLSSAGLRVFLQAQATMNQAGGTMRIVHCQPHIQKLFDIVGFTSVMDVS